MADALVQSAIAHWGPRFVSNGVALTDFEEVTASIATWDDWCRAWSARAAMHEQMGRDALGKKKFLSAGEHLQRAGVYYHFAKFVFVHDIAQMKAAHMKAVECRNLALPHLEPPGERVEIPFEGKKLVGILRKPAAHLPEKWPPVSRLREALGKIFRWARCFGGRSQVRSGDAQTEDSIARPPVMIMAVGLDSTKEETEAYERPFLQRGVAILVFDGPGQGEAEYDMPIRGNYETAVKAVCDYIETRKDLDASRIGLWGVSLGGYYAPRAAAFEQRVKACIALAGPYDMGDAWAGLPDHTREAFRVRSHCKTQDEARKNAATLTLKGVAQNITCPLFIVTGKQDRIVPWQDAERLSREVKGPCELLVVEDGNHIANNRPYRWRLQTADWMAEQLGASGR
jgi:2,6-dihydroxypseudooxynicotine hydrolase